MLVSRYVIVDRLGSGSMGAVHTAYDPELDRRIALKLLHEPPGDGVAAVREAQALARLSHRNVVAVHDAGRHHGRVFIAMEYVAGSNLREWLQAEARGRGEILRVFVAAGRGLAAAHAAGIIHRDFKPDNVLVGTDGSVRVADFGIADIDPRRDDTLALSSGDAATLRPIGTPAYMAPEVRLGTGSDARGDQYSFCVALVEALTQNRPVLTSTLVQLTGDGDALPAAAANLLPLRLRRALRTGLAIDPGRRWPSMTALLDALTAAERSPLRRLLVPGMVTAGIVAGTLLAYPWPGREPPCAGDAALADALWGETQREAVRRAMGTGTRGYEATSLDTTIVALDAWTERWRAQWRDACEATRVRGEQTPDQLALRTSCLESGKARAQAVITLLSRPDERVAEHAVAELAVLPDPEVCADIDALRARIPPPDTREVAQRVAAVRAELARATTLAIAGVNAEARVIGETAIVEADTIGYAPLRAEARTTLASALEQPSERPRAIDLLTESIAIALGVGHDQEAADSVTSLLSVLRNVGETTEALRWARLADALIGRVGDPPRLRAKLSMQLAQIAGARGEPRIAVAHAEQALALVERTAVLHGRRGAAHAVLAGAARNAGEYRRALHHANLAYEDAAESLGERHPVAIAALQMVAISHADHGDHARAIATCERILATIAADADAGARFGLSTRSNLAMFLAAVGRYDEARLWLLLVAADVATRSGGESREYAEALSNRAVVELRDGGAALARALAEYAHDIYDRVTPRHPARAVLEILRGDIAFAQGRLVESRDFYDGALGVAIPAFGAEHPHSIEAAAHLAHVLARLGDGAAAWAKLEPMIADGSMRRPLRALVLVDAVLVAALTHDPREPALRAELMPLLDGLGDGALWHRDDLARWSDPGGAPTR